jgi:hypothetical protein
MFAALVSHHVDQPVDSPLRRYRRGHQHLPHHRHWNRSRGSAGLRSEPALHRRGSRARHRKCLRRSQIAPCAIEIQRFSTIVHTQGRCKVED